MARPLKAAAKALRYVQAGWKVAGTGGLASAECFQAWLLKESGARLSDTSRHKGHNVFYESLVTMSLLVSCPIRSRHFCWPVLPCFPLFNLNFLASAWPWGLSWSVFWHGPDLCFRVSPCTRVVVLREAFWFSVNSFRLAVRPCFGRSVFGVSPLLREPVFVWGRFWAWARHAWAGRRVSGKTDRCRGSDLPARSSICGLK